MPSNPLLGLPRGERWGAGDEFPAFPRKGTEGDKGWESIAGSRSLMSKSRSKTESTAKIAHQRYLWTNKSEKMDITVSQNIFPYCHEYRVWTCLPSK